MSSNSEIPPKDSLVAVEKSSEIPKKKRSVTDGMHRSRLACGNETPKPVAAATDRIRKVKFPRFAKDEFIDAMVGAFTEITEDAIIAIHRYQPFEELISVTVAKGKIVVTKQPKPDTGSSPAPIAKDPIVKPGKSNKRSKKQPSDAQESLFLLPKS